MASTLVLVLESTFEVLEGALKHLSYYKHLCWFVHKHILSQSVSKHILSTLEAQMITVMGIPAAVERVFSIAGKVFKPDRCQLTDATFEKILFMLQ